REVKPARADGTAVTRGRVGRCQILKEACRKLQAFLVYGLFYAEKSSIAGSLKIHNQHNI
ncbi:hypothetical protein, partial [Pedobacter polysacchareus]|uniref:hypothetical protein n=1 Tax=Pedobacter polysacchareus TaxID=2861973 RepID=UPI001C996279